MADAPVADLLVVGSGIAGLWFALKASRHGSVHIVTKKHDSESNTNYAQGGIAAAVAENDSPGLHSEDTTRAGISLVHPEIVHLVTSSGPRLVRELFDVGVRFSSYVDAKGRRQFDLGREGGHRRRRILHAQDYTGLEIERALLAAVRSQPNVTISEEHFAVDIGLDDGGRCCGLHVLDTTSGRNEFIRAKVTFLAAGGIGQVYRHTTNPPIATGDGIAIAYRAGARIANMEFIQFHPTSLYGHQVNGRAFLVSEALRGEGAILRTIDGETFMEKYHRDASLAPRDVVARAIDAEMRARDAPHVLLDATHLSPDRLRERFPSISRGCMEFGIDIGRMPIPVVPAAHYACGGALVDDRGRTSIAGVYAAGECACTGLHGANRLASNSLLEALVFADRASEDVAGVSSQPAAVTLPPSLSDGVTADDGDDLEAERGLIRDLMWGRAGIVRDDVGLDIAAARLQELEAQTDGRGGRLSVAGRETLNLLSVARLIVTSALGRPESRGLHYNRDHPEPDPALRRDTVVTIDANVKDGPGPVN